MNSKPKRMSILTIILLAYLIFLATGHITYTNKERVYKVEYKGLLWVVLDYYTIIKYNSDDVPMKWIDCTRKITSLPRK